MRLLQTLLLLLIKNLSVDELNQEMKSCCILRSLEERSLCIKHHACLLIRRNNTDFSWLREIKRGEEEKGRGKKRPLKKVLTPREGKEDQVSSSGEKRGKEGEEEEGERTRFLPSKTRVLSKAEDKMYFLLSLYTSFEERDGDEKETQKERKQNETEEGKPGEEQQLSLPHDFSSLVCFSRHPLDVHSFSGRRSLKSDVCRRERD